MTMLTLRSILCPVDLSEGSGRLLHLAAALAQAHGARLVVLHVAETPPFVSPGDLQKALRRKDGYRHELEELLHGLAPGLPCPAEYRVEDGDPVTEILYQAADLPCDLIVLGTHGRTGLGRVFLGSVAEAVVRKAPCPVLTLKVPAANGAPDREGEVSTAGTASPVAPR
jgi:nucleotide-binding universal stress UspA family protein